MWIEPFHVGWRKQSLGQYMDEPFPSSKILYFQNYIKCKTILVKICFICMGIRIHFHIRGFALSLTLKQSLWATWKNDRFSCFWCFFLVDAGYCILCTTLQVIVVHLKLGPISWDFSYVCR